MNIRQNRWTLAICAMSVLLAPLSLAQTELTAARGKVDIAQQQIQDKKFRKAGRLLGGIDCDGEVNCETLKQFSRGFLYEAWAQADREKQSILLARAVEFYGEARRLSPDNVQILTNLALAARSAGDLMIATDSATRLVTLDSAGAYEHTLFLGDLLLAGEDTPAAMRAYESAIELNEARPEARRRILNLRIGGGNSGDVFERSQILSRDFPEIAIVGFCFVVNNDFRTDSERSEEALTQWAALRANLGQIGEAELGALPEPKVWRSAGIAELHEVISGRESSLSWWSETSERRDAISRVLRRQAATLRATQSQEVEERHRSALQLLSQAVEIAPPYSAYLEGPLEDSTNAQLDAAIDLVTLHHEIKAGQNYNELSGVSASELKAMTVALFNGKSRAYAAGQMEAIQRYHTVLGMLYYETGRFKSGGAANAEFQLFHALKTADRIAREEPGQYKPLPELERMLAEVYFKRADIAQGSEKRTENKKGAERSLRAAMGFLETDNFPAATTALKLAKGTGAGSKRTQAVGTILRSRELLQAEGLRAAEVEGQTVILKAELNWLTDSSTLGLDREFIARQRFKVLSDLGSELEKGGHADLSRRVNAQALSAASKQKVLTSVQDIRRIESIESSLSTGSFKSPQTKVTRQLNSLPVNTNEQVWALPLNTGSIAIQANSKLTEAARALDDPEKNRMILVPSVNAPVGVLVE